MISLIAFCINNYYQQVKKQNISYFKQPKKICLYKYHYYQVFSYIWSYHHHPREYNRRQEKKQTIQYS